MRQIKFRAWDKVNNEMIELSEMFTLIGDGGHLVFGFEDYPEHTWKERPISEFELMQFTGLLDKNGKEIYEGDIFFNDDLKVNGVVKWDKEQDMFVTEYEDGDYYPLWCSVGNLYEVIGNIYEHPNLFQ